jgi:hypothetical protein
MNAQDSTSAPAPAPGGICPACGAAIPATHDRCAACAGPVTLARPIEDTIRRDLTVGSATLHAGYLATIVALDRRRPDPVEIVTCPLSRAELDRTTPFDESGALKPGQSAEDWPPLARVWAPEDALSAWPSTLRRQRWSVAADSCFDPSLLDEAPMGWSRFWRRRDSVVTIVTVAFILLMTVMIIATTVGHMGPLSPLTPMSPNG